MTTPSIIILNDDPQQTKAIREFLQTSLHIITAPPLDTVAFSYSQTEEPRHPAQTKNNRHHFSKIQQSQAARNKHALNRLPIKTRVFGIR